MKAVNSETRAACCMLWVTMAIVYSRLQFVDQFLDLGGRDRIERRAGLVEQDDFRLDRDGARDAQALLLAAGQAEAAGIELVLHLVPERGAAQRRLDASVELALAAASRRA